MSTRTLVKGASPCIYLTVNIRRRIKTWLPVGMLQVSCGSTTQGCYKGRAVGGCLCGQLQQCPLNACLHLSGVCPEPRHSQTASRNFSSHIHQTGMERPGAGWASRAGKEKSPGLRVYLNAAVFLPSLTMLHTFMTNLFSLFL